MSLILLQNPKVQLKLQLGKGVALDHLQKLTANLDLFLDAVGLFLLRKSMISQELHLGARVAQSPLLNPKLLLLGLSLGGADQVHPQPVKGEDHHLQGAAVLSLLQNINQNPELLAEALGLLQSQRQNLAHHLGVVAPDHHLS